MGATVWKAVAAPRGARGGGGERSEPDPTETPREGDGSAVAVWACRERAETRRERGPSETRREPGGEPVGRSVHGGGAARVGVELIAQ